MKQWKEIRQKKEILAVRSEIIRAIREFFWSQNFIEIEAPIAVACPGQEPHLSPVSLTLHDETGTDYRVALHTSPEYAMKKMLAAGFEKIFYLGKCFRDYESFGGTHNPEFTLLEWYRAGGTMWTLMEDVEELFLHLLQMQKRLEIRDWRKISMRELWKEYAVVDLNQYLTAESLRELCLKKGYAPKEDEPYEDLFYRIFLNEVEPKLTGGVMIYHYPRAMAALAKLSDEDPRYAERVEVYVNGLELANGFSELTDPEEQMKRLMEEQEQRKQSDKQIFPIDIEFIEAVGAMPSSAGIALGVDRLVMLLTGCENIDDVLVLPASGIFHI